MTSGSATRYAERSALVAAVTLLFFGGIPTRQPGSAAPDAERGPRAREAALV